MKPPRRRPALYQRGSLVRDAEAARPRAAPKESWPIPAWVPAGSRRGVLPYSSGNNAQAIALASRLLGAAATIVMPADAPAAKRRAPEGYGARVVTYDPATERREEVADRLAREGNPMLIPPFDHPD